MDWLLFPLLIVFICHPVIICDRIKSHLILCLPSARGFSQWYGHAYCSRHTGGSITTETGFSFIIIVHHGCFDIIGGWSRSRIVVEKQIGSIFGITVAPGVITWWADRRASRMWGQWGLTPHWPYTFPIMMVFVVMFWPLRNASYVSYI